MEENNKKEKKKIKFSKLQLAGVIILSMFVGSIFGGGTGSNSTDGSKTTSATSEVNEEPNNGTKETGEIDENAVDVSEPSVETEVSTEIEKNKEFDDDNHVSIGESVNLADMLIITPTCAYVMYDDYNRLCAFVDFDVESTADKRLTISATDCSLYIDDYQYQNIGVTNGTTEYTFVTLDPGRKAIFCYGAAIPDECLSADKIEVSIPGDSTKTVLVKYDGEYVNDISSKGIGDIINQSIAENAAETEHEEMYPYEGLFMPIGGATGPSIELVEYTAKIVYSHVTEGGYFEDAVINGDIMLTSVPTDILIKVDGDIAYELYFSDTFRYFDIVVCGSDEEIGPYDAMSLY